MLSFDDAGRPLAWPGLRRIKLWRETLNALGTTVTGLDRVFEGIDKFQLPLSPSAAAAPVPLKALYVLEAGPEDAAAGTVRLSGSAAVLAIVPELFRREALAAMALEPRALAQVAAVARHARIFRATRAWGFDMFEADAARLERHMLDA